MLKLLKNLNCYAPKNIGKKDLILCGDKIFKMEYEFKYINENIFEEVYDCEGLYAFPGIIDQHVHIIGGGGEDGFNSHIPEIEFNQIIEGGVTTVVGLLGANSLTKNLDALYVKAKALEKQGLTTYIYSGSYLIPPVTITGSIMRDLLLIDKVVGLGEIAIADHRSSHPSLEQLIQLASEAHIGGLFGEKAGIIHLHLGEGNHGFELIEQLIKKTEFAKEQFVPTHVNRNLEIFKQSLKYCKAGGYIDLTSGEKNGISVPKAIEYLENSEIDLSKVTVSSDANGSIPEGGASKIQTLFDDIAECVHSKKIKKEIAFSLVTENVAKLLKIYPKKGTLKEGSDADILITDKNLKIKKLFSLGNLLIDN